MENIQLLQYAIIEKYILINTILKSIVDGNELFVAWLKVVHLVSSEQVSWIYRLPNQF